MSLNFTRDLNIEPNGSSIVIDGSNQSNNDQGLYKFDNLVLSKGT